MPLIIQLCKIKELKIMTDVYQSTRKFRAKPRRSFEFILYFSIIFVLAIPFSTVIWIAEVFRKKSVFVDYFVRRRLVWDHLYRFRTNNDGLFGNWLNILRPQNPLANRPDSSFNPYHTFTRCLVGFYLRVTRILENLRKQ